MTVFGWSAVGEAVSGATIELSPLASSFLTSAREQTVAASPAVPLLPRMLTITEVALLLSGPDSQPSSPLSESDLSLTETASPSLASDAEVLSFDWLRTSIGFGVESHSPMMSIHVCELTGIRSPPNFSPTCSSRSCCSSKAGELHSDRPEKRWWHILFIFKGQRSWWGYCVLLSAWQTNHINCLHISPPWCSQTSLLHWCRPSPPPWAPSSSSADAYVCHLALLWPPSASHSSSPGAGTCCRAQRGPRLCSWSGWGRGECGAEASPSSCERCGGPWQRHSGGEQRWWQVRSCMTAHTSRKQIQFCLLSYLQWKHRMHFIFDRQHVYGKCSRKENAVIFSLLLQPTPLSKLQTLAV